MSTPVTQSSSVGARSLPISLCVLKAYIINESVTVKLALEGGFSLEVAFYGFKI